MPWRAADAERLLEEAARQRAAGAFDDAYGLAVEAAAALRRTHGPRSPTLVVALLAVGAVEQDLGRLDAAEQAMTRAMAIVLDAQTGVEVERCCRLALADLFRAQARYTEADDLLRTLDLIRNDRDSPVETRCRVERDHPALVSHRRLHKLLIKGADRADGTPG